MYGSVLYLGGSPFLYCKYIRALFASFERLRRVINAASLLRTSIVICPSVLS